MSGVQGKKEGTICFTARHYYRKTVGGAEVQVFLLAREFARQGWQVHLISPDIDGEAVDEGIRLHPFPSGRSFRENQGKLKGILFSISPDVCYQRGRSEWTAMTASCCRRIDVPFVFALSMDIDCRRFRNAARIASWKACRRPKMAAHILRTGWHDLYSLRGMRQADAILCQTSHQQVMLKNYLGLDSRLVRNMHPVPPRPQRLDDSTPLVLWLASVKQWKRPELFVRLAKNLAETGCRFILAGRLADASYRSMLEHASFTLPAFRYIEEIDLDESNRLLEQADIFINTSERNEGFPNTFIQAWLRGVVTVSLDFDPDGVIEGQRLGFRSGTFEQLCKDVVWLLENACQRKEMGKKARKWAIEEFGMDKNFVRLERLVLELTGKADF